MGPLPNAHDVSDVLMSLSAVCCHSLQLVQAAGHWSLAALLNVRYLLLYMCVT